MQIVGDFKKNVKKLQKYLVNKHNFICVENDSIDDAKEYELYLVNRDKNLRIHLTKYFNDNDIDVTINGYSSDVDQYSLYISYFFNPQQLKKAKLNNFIEQTDKEVSEYD